MAKCNRLYTKTAFKRVPGLRATEHQGDDAVAFVKIFSITSDHRHYILEYDPETGHAYVLTTNLEVIEFGYICLREFQELNDNFRRRGFSVPPYERELHGTPRDGYRVGRIKELHALGRTP
ncbi:MAG: hypothetical protein ACXAC5_02315 [Promethearchaeota archaeon]|jgi:hypothetical protein